MKTVRWTALAALIVSTGATQAAPTPLCQRPEVLQEVARTVRTWNLYNTIDDDSVTEAPTDRANAVICHATMNSIAYAQTPAGWEQRPYREVRRYDVAVEGNRFTVRMTP